MPIEDLWASMAVVDQKTNMSRGYFVISTWKEEEGDEVESAKVESDLLHEVIESSRRKECPPLIRSWKLHQRAHPIREENQITFCPRI